MFFQVTHARAGKVMHINVNAVACVGTLDYRYKGDEYNAAYERKDVTHLRFTDGSLHPVNESIEAVMRMINAALEGPATTAPPDNHRVVNPHRR